MAVRRIRGWMAGMSAALLALSACKGSGAREDELPDIPPTSAASMHESPAPDVGYSSAPEAPAPAPAARAVRTHVVRPGDSLFGIARQYYNNDASQWRRILAANSDRIKDKNQIKVGQELVIPE